MSDIPEADKGVYGSDAENGNQNNLIDFLTPDSTTSAAPLPVPLPSLVPLTPVQAPSSMSTAESITPSTAGTVSKMVTANSWSVNSGASSPKSTTGSVGRASPPTIMPPPPPPQASALNKVFMSSETYRFCLTHALSTEVEEIMGLLIGRVDETNGYCYISHSLPLKRLDKRKDRVEIGIEQLGSAIGVVEELSASARYHVEQELMNGQDQNHHHDHGNNGLLPSPLSVVGWYHSHPHITVFPSEVDISTHHQYQSTMSTYWIGLIFGVFNYDESTGTNRFQLIAFQSINNGGGRGLKHVLVPIVIEPRLAPMCDSWALKKASTLIDLLLEEEKEAFMMNRGGGEMRQEFMANHYNVCVFSKAVAKIISLLGAPMIDVLNATDEMANRLLEI